MAIERNDINFLNDIQIKTESNRRFFQDIRSLMFFTKDFAIEPTFIKKPQDVLELGVSGLDENHEFYKLIQSAFSQAFLPVVTVVYGNNVANSFAKLMETYKNHEKAFEVTNWITNIDAKANKTYIESIVAYAKTDKEIQVGIALDIEKLTVTEAIKYQTSANAENVMFVAEGGKNTKTGNWLTGAIFGGYIGTKSLGSYIVHSAEIRGFEQEAYTPSEQKAMKDAGLNFLSKPTKGYFHVVNGLNSDNKTFTELNLIKIWLKDRIQKDITVMQITNDKIPNDDNGRAMVDAVIREVCRIGANAGMFMTAAGDYFGTITEKDKNGNTVKIQLGYLKVESITQESLREGLFDFDLMLTYLNGARKVTLRGTITTEGKLVY
ncbi:MAG: DUF3383 family protein [Pseudoleptotrichia goodfellowii]|nr:DUF3383 family protein [Pseudoleptotrichia goodfellowii]